MSKPASLLPKIEELLVAEIPRAVKAAKISDPIYCLRIWYNGTDSSSEAVPYCMLIKESIRQSHIAKNGLKDAGAIWMADEWTYPEMKFDVYISNSKLDKFYGQWYDWLCEQDDEEEGLQSFREMVQRVSQKLNLMNWAKEMPVTDDFVVFPADGSHTFCDDTGDLLASITPAQQALLRSRNMIPEQQ